jgi:PAS domain S-box-containing protein
MTPRTSAASSSNLSAYLVAVVATAIAIGLRALADPWLGTYLLFTPLFAAIAVTVWHGGWRPALVAALLGLLAYVYLFMEPRGSFVIQHSKDYVACTLYFVTSSIILGFGEGMRRAQRRAAEGRERLRTTLASIGDAVIATDLKARVTMMNPVAESLTGWAIADARGKPLSEIFRIVNEQTRKPVDNPAERALREGAIVGLANHTILIARDGTETHIDDSAAPIRCADGEIVGCVLVFRDITDRREAEHILRDRQAWLQGQREALESAINGAPLATSLGFSCALRSKRWAAMRGGRERASLSPTTRARRSTTSSECPPTMPTRSMGSRSAPMRWRAAWRPPLARPSSRPTCGKSRSGNRTSGFQRSSITARAGAFRFRPAPESSRARWRFTRASRAKRRSATMKSLRC